MFYASQEPVLRVIRAYDKRLIRTYCWLRFWILRQRFLDEIGQYLPKHGRVLDVGCGFGLFSLYYALTSPRLQIHGVDISPSRIELARCAAKRLGLTNVEYTVADATGQIADTTFDAIYMLDIVHHIPKQEVAPLVNRLASALASPSLLIVKDVDRRPAYKRWFTHALDKVMSWSAPVCYWSAEELERVLTSAGFTVRRHLMVDFLPYPHVIFVCAMNPKSDRRG